MDIKILKFKSYFDKLMIIRGTNQLYICDIYPSEEEQKILNKINELENRDNNVIKRKQHAERNKIRKIKKQLLSELLISHNYSI